MEGHTEQKLPSSACGGGLGAEESGDERSDAVLIVRDAGGSRGGGRGAMGAMAMEAVEGDVGNDGRGDDDADVSLSWDWG